MKPRILVPVRSFYKDWFLTPSIMERLEELGEVELAVDPADLPRKDYVELFRGKDAD